MTTRPATGTPAETLYVFLLVLSGLAAILSAVLAVLGWLMDQDQTIVIGSFCCLAMVRNFFSYLIELNDDD